MRCYIDKLNSLLGGGASKIDAAYEVILKMILDNKFEAGEILSERSLSAALGISRTPIRAALNRLVYEGYADMRADVCTMVAELGLEDILELYELREALECKAVELFTQRRTGAEEEELKSCFEAHKRAAAGGDDPLARKLDDELHLLIARGSKNKRMYSSLNTYITLSQRSAEITASYVSRYAQSIPQHEKIIDRIINGDAQGAAETMREHLVDSREFFKKRSLFEY